MSVAIDDLVAVVQTVFATSAGIDLSPTTNAVASPVTAGIRISGAWCATISLALSPELAKHAASRIFVTDAEALTHSDVADAVGELANMIGGNVKAIMPQPSDLSLPTFNVTYPSPAVVAVRLGSPSGGVEVCIEEIGSQ